MSAKIPDGIINVKAYESYLKKMKFIDNPDWSHYTTKSLPEGVDLFKSRYDISSVISTLPVEEQEEILAAYDKLAKARASASRLLGKAKSDSQIRKLSTMPRHKINEILDLFGKYYTLDEVYLTVISDWGFHDVRKSEIDRFRKNNINIIEQKRSEYKRDVSEIRLGYKRSRLEELSHLYSIRKREFDNNNYSREDERELRAILEQIRKEVEGDKLVIDGNLDMKVSHQIEAHVNINLMKELPMKSIILARAAAKLNVSVEKLVYKLSHSYYSKYTGFSGRPTIEDTDVKYPSQFMYDFTDIADKHENGDVDGLYEDDQGVAETVSESEADDLKSKLMKASSNRVKNRESDSNID